MSTSLKIGVLLDATGSMAADRYRTIDGFNEYLNGLKTSESTREAVLSLARFNDGEGFRVIRRDEVVQDFADLVPEEYACDFCTPLFDAFVQMVGLLERGATADRYVVMVMTDGLENASREATFQTVNDIVKEKRAAGNWTFTFIGADMDAWSAQQAMGIALASASNTMSYNKAESDAAYRNVAEATVAFASSSCSSTDTFFGGNQTVAGNGDNPDLAPDQAAASIGVTSAALAKMRQRGQGPSYTKSGHRTVRYTRRDVEDWKQAHKITTGSS